MIKRIDIRKEEGEYQLFLIEEGGEKILDNSNLKNWIIEIKSNQLIVVGLSNANKHKDRIQFYPLQEGSLFLYNSTYNWYSFFRKKENQELFDKYNLVKAINVNKIIELEFQFDNGVCINPIQYINGFTPIRLSKSDFEVVTEKGTTNFYSIVFKWTGDINSYIIQTGKNDKSNLLYLNATTKLLSLENIDENKKFDIYDYLKQEGC